MISCKEKIRKLVYFQNLKQGARWLSGTGSDSGARGRGFETCLHCVVSLSKTLYSLEVLVIPRKGWLPPYMTEKLLTGTLNLNKIKQTKPEIYISDSYDKEILSSGYSNLPTVISLNFQTVKTSQTVQTQIRLLLEEEQSDPGLHCLLSICIIWRH